MCAHIHNTVFLGSKGHPVKLLSEHSGPLEMILTRRKKIKKQVEII